MGPGTFEKTVPDVRPVGVDDAGQLPAFSHCCWERMNSLTCSDIATSFSCQFQVKTPLGIFFIIAAGGGGFGRCALGRWLPDSS